MEVESGDKAKVLTRQVRDAYQTSIVARNF
jgi:hypothetical protein